MLLLTFSTLLFAFVSAQQPSCKCLSSDTCFPSRQEWEKFALDQLTEGSLLYGQRPLAAPCYKETPDYNEDKCKSATSFLQSGQSVAPISNALEFSNREGYLVNDTMQDCPLEHETGRTCFQGRIPTIAVNVSNVHDIQNTIKFATEKNLKLVVRNNGHDHLGRAFGVGAVEIFTHFMRGLEYAEDFVPEGATEDISPQPAITIGPGVQWHEIYEFAQKHNKTVPGGVGPKGTVGAGGGWLQGGGHGPLAQYYGLGIDNVLQFKVVLPDASYVTANAYQNIDLFWALRGGGGPSFGVATAITYAAHPTAPYTVAYFEAQANSVESYRTMLEFFGSHHNDIADSGWRGIWPFFNNGLYLTLITQGDPPTSSTANATLENFFKEVKSLSGVDVTLAITVPYANWFDFQFEWLVDTENAKGLNISATYLPHSPASVNSWLLPREVTEPENAAQLVDALLDIPFGTGFLIGGGRVSEVAEDATATTPAFRRALTSITLTVPVDTASANAYQSSVESIHSQATKLRELAAPPFGGQYLNEGDALEEEWQEAHWGSNYPRLLSIKQTIDPNDLFIVYHGVNSEAWDDEKTCKLHTVS